MRGLTGLLLALVLHFAGVEAVRADVVQVAEAQKIEYLIRSVARLPNAKFIRNDTPYDAQAAAEHLRLKLREAGSRVKTAEDFIRLCASKSSVSGRPYEIRFADGTLSTSEAFLRAKLSELSQRGEEGARLGPR